MKETHTVRRKLKTLKTQIVMRDVKVPYLLLIVPGSMETL